MHFFIIFWFSDKYGTDLQFNVLNSLYLTWIIWQCTVSIRYSKKENFVRSVFLSFMAHYKNFGVIAFVFPYLGPIKEYKDQS